MTIYSLILVLTTGTNFVFLYHFTMVNALEISSDIKSFINSFCNFLWQLIHFKFRSNCVLEFAIKTIVNYAVYILSVRKNRSSLIEGETYGYG